MAGSTIGPSDATVSSVAPPFGGLGESLAGSTDTPDSLVGGKSDWAVTDRAIADKQRMTVTLLSGPHKVVVPRFPRQEATLNDGQAAAIAQLALLLGAALGWLVDVECSYTRGQLYLLQCRPITALGRAYGRR
jgi:phosphoenolpyruvate synthase/pyruvate phosphate dikinase